MTSSNPWETERNKIIGLSDNSVRKSYFPELQKNYKNAKEKEENLSAILNSVLDGIFIHDFEGRIFDVNDAVCRMYKIRREEALLLNIKDFSVKPFSDLKTLWDKIGTEKSLIFEWKALRPLDKTQFEVEVSLQKANWFGKPAVIDVVRDINDQKLLQEQLLQSQKMDVVGQLAGGIAHDFNNMLTGILGNAEMINLLCKTESSIKGYAENILKISRRAGELTSKLLAFSRKGKLMSIALDVHEIIQSSVAILERSIDKKITIKTCLQAKKSCITGDPALLENVILNLGINARDAMPQGGQLTLSTQNLSFSESSKLLNLKILEPGEYLYIEISDTGCGIPKELLSKIFEPFFTTKETGKGTGLGLAAVYGSVKDHKGAIDVYSEEGIGTVFKIYLPLEKNTAPSEKIKEEAIEKGKGRILVIDDEAFLRKVISDLLSSLGYEVLLAEGGKKGIEIYSFEKDTINLVLLDMVMPEMNGKETFLKLKEINPDVKVIFSSGFNKEGRAEELLALGAKGIIPKPYRLNELSRIIKKNL